MDGEAVTLDPQGRATVSYPDPDAHEALGAFIGFMHGFAVSGLAFVGNVLDISLTQGDLIANWGEAIRRTAEQMKEIMALLGAVDACGGGNLGGGSMNGSRFNVGFKLTVVPPQPQRLRGHPGRRRGLRQGRAERAGLLRLPATPVAVAE